MNTRSSFDQHLADWLEDGPTDAPDQILETILAAVPSIPQRRAALGVPWRSSAMPTLARALVGIAAVVIVAAAILLFQPRLSGVGPPFATPSSTPTSSVAMPTTPPSATPAPSIGVGVDATGAIYFGQHSPSTDTTTLYAIDPDGTGEHVLLPESACCLAISPRGEWIDYAIVRAGRLVPVIRRADNGAIEEMTWSGSGSGGPIDSVGLNLAPGAASDRNGISDTAFEGWDDAHPERTGLYVNVDNGGSKMAGVLKRLTTTTGSLHDVPVGFSPDGLRLLFIRDRDAGDGVAGDLYVIGTDGSGLRRLNPETARVEVSDAFGPGASWSPDGRLVAFSGFDATKTDGTSAVYVVDAAKGPAVAITQPGSFTTSARWSPDGQWIAFDKGPDKHDIYLIHSDGTALKNITPSIDVGVCCGQWSLDSKWLVVQGSLTNRDDQTDLFVVSAVDSTFRRLTQDPGEYLNWVGWGGYP